MRIILIVIYLQKMFLNTSGQVDTIALDYDYYKSQYDKGIIMRNVGKGLAIGGPLLAGSGVMLTLAC